MRVYAVANSFISWELSTRRCAGRIICQRREKRIQNTTGLNRTRVLRIFLWFLTFERSQTIWRNEKKL